MKIDLDKLSFYECGKNDLEDILRLQEEVIASLMDKNLLRRNTEQMFIECLQNPNYTVGVRHEGRLVALSILYFPKDENEDLTHLLSGVEYNGIKSANLKLCMVAKDYRGNGLQVYLGKMLERRAKEQGVELLCSTVSPDNEYSQNNLRKLGYAVNSRHKKYGSIRDLFCKYI